MLLSQGTGVATLLVRRRPTQRAEVGCRSGAVIADGVSRNEQGGAAERHDDPDDSDHQDRCAAPRSDRMPPHCSRVVTPLLSALVPLEREPRAALRPANDPAAAP